MTEYELKIKPKKYKAVMDCKELFEVCRYDRDYEKGDTVLLREWKNGGYTGNTAEVMIYYIITHDDCPDGIKKGYCVLGLLPKRKGPLVEQFTVASLYTHFLTVIKQTDSKGSLRSIRELSKGIITTIDKKIEELDKGGKNE